jgi:hypothetical protein
LLDPLEGEVDDGPVGAWRLLPQRPVRAAAVAVAHIAAQRAMQVPLASDERRQT